MSDEALTLTAAEAARLLGITLTEFRRIVRSGHIEAIVRGPYRMVDVVRGHARYLRAEHERRQTAATNAEAARHIGISPQRFCALVNAGAITLQPAGYNLDVVRREYGQHLERVATGRNFEAEGIAAKVELVRAQREAMALHNAESNAKYVHRDVVIRDVGRDYDQVRRRANKITDNVVDDLVGQDRETIYACLYAEISAALSELSAPARRARDGAP
jgi:hypothetical protein